uniref:ATPase n=1 Tax=Thermodesulfobacterium geofontis TaxID=1295609 RepID=A0A7V5XGK4_9BACT
MKVKKLKISNFKSFENLEIELGKFNVLIGPNASGKSNFIQIFKFLRDIANHGLDNAISMQGGIEFLRNINIGPSQNFSLEVVLDEKYGALIPRRKEKGRLGIKIYETTYKFAMGFKKKGVRFEIIEDKLTQKFNIVRLELKRGKREKEEKLGQGQGELTISQVNGKIVIESLKIPEGISIKEDYIFPFLKFIKEIRLEPHTLLLEGSLPFFPIPPILRDILSEILICDFDPKLPKRPTPITGKAEIVEDGSNLAIIVKNIIENKEKRRKLFNLIKDLLPFVDDLGVETFVDKSLLFKLKEIYTKKQYLPAFLISDGTINITALIIALYFEKKRLTIIEEPERNIHPHLLSKVVEMMKDASRNKQIIVSTHNPEIVKHAGLENILLISRNEEGFSVITKPLEKETVKIFLQNELGIDELYVQNLL